MVGPTDSKAREPITFATAPRYEHDGTVFLSEDVVDELVEAVVSDHSELLRRLAER